DRERHHGLQAGDDGGADGTGGGQLVDPAPQVSDRRGPVRPHRRRTPGARSRPTLTARLPPFEQEEPWPSPARFDVPVPSRAARASGTSTATPSDVTSSTRCCCSWACPAGW